MKVGITKAILLLVFRPVQFIQLSEKYAEELNRLQHQRDEASKPESKSQNESSSAQQTRDIRAALIHSALLVIAVVLVGCASGLALSFIMGPPGQWTSRVILYTGISILLWATLGKGGWGIRSFSGRTLPGQVDQYLFRTLHLFGSFLLVLSATWQASYWS